LTSEPTDGQDGASGALRDAIAIVGMAGRFPGARDLAQFWRNLRDGVESVRRLAPAELAALGAAAAAAEPGFVPVVAEPDGIEEFDAPFFGVSHREAELMDPQHRLFLECCWEALESAGHLPESFRGEIGVYGGATTSTYLLFNLAGNPRAAAADPLQLIVGNAVDSLTTRVSFKLDLRGPSHAVQSACSTALVAVHLACESLLDQRCDMALAGGVSIQVGQRAGYRWQPGSILSPDGHCRAFDAAAQGTVFGSGCGVVVLRRLEEALADGDPVRAVIRGSAINNDGASKVGFSAPSVEGEARAIAEALTVAGVPAASIGYVEAHGTGTALGDPIEIQALTRAFRAETARRAFCALGTVKNNIGHLDTAAGIAGLIKTVLMLEHRAIPPALHFERPNPRIDFAASPFYVNSCLTEWPAGEAPRRAGVSAFGFGGTNAHLVLEEAPAPAPVAEAVATRALEPRPARLLLLSARSEAALAQVTRRLAEHLDDHPDSDLADVAWTLHAGRRTFSHRRALVCASAADAAEALRRPTAARLATAYDAAAPRERAIAFLLPGQGAQHAGMGRAVYEREPVFRQHLDAAARLLEPQLGLDLRQLLYPAPERRAAADERLRRTRFAQPALFVVEYALARLWEGWGVAPRALLGHSLGEYVAACLAGVFALPDALTLVAARGRLIDELPGGAMLAVALPEREAAACLTAPELPAGLAVAAINEPGRVVVGGPEPAVAALEARLRADGVEARRLHTSHAFHTPAIAPAAAPFAEVLAGVRLAPPAIPFLSNVTGGWIRAEEATSPDYWVRQLLAPVRFADALAALLAEPDRVLLEVGPGRTLASLAARQAAGRTVVASLPHPREDEADHSHLLAAAGRLWLAGQRLDAPGLHGGERRRRLVLPTYPFERHRYWIEPAVAPWASRAADPGSREAAEAAGAPAGAAPAPASAVASHGSAPARTAGGWTLHPRPPLPTPFVAPRGELEEQVAEIWRQVLGLETVGAQDSFLELGGDSLLATQLVASLRQTFAVELPVDQLFRAPTVDAVAAAVAARRAVPGAATPAGPAAATPAVRAAATPAVRSLAPADDIPAAPASPDPAADYPLSFAQERMWFLDRFDPDQPTYNMPAALRITGRLSPALLRRSLGEVVRRHGVLRATLVLPPGAGAQARPVQRIAPFTGDPAAPLVDFSVLAEATGRREAGRQIAAEAARPFDLARGPLLRLLLLRISSREHLAFFVVHHIVSDGLSMEVLTRELVALYSAFGAGRPSPLPALRFGFGEVAAWQRAWLQGERLAAELAFWRDELAGAPALVDLPLDRPRPPVQRFAGGSFTVALPAALVASLRAVLRAEGVTLFMGMLAAFAALLVRHGGADELVVGTPVGGRGQRGTETLIGPFLNSLALRSDLRGDPSCRELLARTRQRAIAAFAHQQLPFEKLVEELSPQRNLAHAPIYQVMVVAQAASMARLRLPGLELAQIDLEASTSKLDLTLSYLDEGGALELRWMYKRDLFDAASVRRLARRFEALLAGLVADPGRRLWELPLLGPSERRQLAEWNDTAAAYPREPCLHELLAAQAARSPQRPAVVYEGRSLTYGELFAAAGRLARRLRELGVGPDRPVGVCAERSLEMVVALLAVLEAGGAYLPLDPDYPRERLAHMLEESRSAVVLCQQRLTSRLPALPGGARRMELDGVVAGAEQGDPGGAGSGDAGGAGLARRGGVSLARPGGAKVRPDNLAYVIYTSGSTGRPKGVMNTHRAIVNRLLWMQEAYGLGLDDRVLQKTPFSFDVSVWELFWPLLVGARLVMARPGGHQDGAYLAATIRQEGITTLHFVPSMLQVFLGTPGVERCRSLERVMASGEALPAELAERFFARLPGVELHNLYGPTEAAVDVTAFACAPGARARGRGGVPIGRPVANSQILLLDRGHGLAPIGVAGELAIAGVQLARGYLARPDLTAERFVPDPTAAHPGARVYLTGDLARHLPDGTIEFLGRLDHQVKLRGLRIELGEIEAALAAHPAVREAVVVPDAGTGGGALGGANLVAYVTPADAATEPSLAALRPFLARTLPDYMLPAALVVMPALPLTASGKVDRRALPAPQRGQAAGRPGDEEPRRRVAPRNALEARLALLWSEALGSVELGVEDNFFALGGNSITGAIFINRLQEALGEIVHVVTLFDAPTIAQLAAHLESDYPRAVERLTGDAPLGAAAGEGGGGGGRSAGRALGEADLDQAQRLIRTLAPPEASTQRGDQRVLFVLSPPRSGSTLLRVMLAGHQRLFAPPELELLNFQTLAERRQVFQGRDAFRLEGAVRAVMEARGCDAAAAQTLLAGLEAGGLTTRELYGLLRYWIGERLLVDKTPTYAWDPAALRQAEESFAEPLYLHLTRHPYGMVRSFEEARIDQIFFHAEHPWTRRELGELLWALAHRNILAFLGEVPARRQHQLAFESLLAAPERELWRICDFLGLDYQPEMAEPYRQSSARMTDGLHAASRMIGDVKFHQHGRIDPRVAERWREWVGEDDFLSAPARRLALRLGYDLALPPHALAPAAATAVPAISVGAAAAASPRPAAPPAIPAARTAESALPALAPTPPAAALEEGGEPRLSFAQERLWFLDQLDPGKPTYNIPAVLRLRGALQGAALAAALAEVVRRHAVLRTSYPVVAERPVQRVAAWRESRGLPLPVIDLADLDGGARELELDRQLLREVSRPFDLERGPVLRASLLRLAAFEHVLIFVMHHIASDGWSMGVLVREMVALYEAACLRRPSPLPELPLQYLDFAAWQRGWLAGGRLEREVAYWRERLAGAPALDLPTDNARPPVQTFRGAKRRFVLPPKVAEAAHRLSRRLGATPFMTALSAFLALLARHSGQGDLCVGIPYAGRDRLELEDLIGFFINTLVVRADLADDPSFEALVGRVRAAALGAFAHHAVPFEKVVEELRPERDQARSPLFQVMFAWQNQPLGRIALRGLEIAIEQYAAGGAKFELSLSLTEYADELVGVLEYKRDLFEAATAARLEGHFVRLLGEAAAVPERRVGELPLWDESERWQAMGEWNDTAARWSGGEAGVHALFESQAAARPRAVALGWRAGGETARMSYAELEARANRLARRLRRLGVGPESRVGLLVERTPELVVALLAVLKAGGAYVPLDPDHPVERLAMALADSGAEVVVTQRAVWERLGEGLPDAAAARGGHRQLLVLDDPQERERTAAEPAARLAVEVWAESLAYVIYTSGSTGRPKGVELAHGAVVNFLRAMAQRPGLEAGAVVPALTTVSFDIAVLEIFLPLAVGARVEMMSRQEAADGEKLGRRLAHDGATLLQATPAGWQVLVESGWRAEAGLRALCGGEALSWELAGKLVGGGCELWNVYGPTETAVWSAVRRVDEDARPEGGGGSGAAVPLGRPIANLAFYVVDARGRPVPVGVVGELWIGGAGLARGYRGRPELTAERFVPDPFGPMSGARLYRTGDLVRWLAGGELEFLGRLDHQVKVRGFRIELGEIEAALLRQPGVEQAVVVALGEAGERRLVAYLVAPGQGAPAERELREGLRRQLPEYMLPAAYVVLGALPLTPSGKVDRKALPALAAPAGAVAGEESYVAPSGAVETLLAEIWAAVLRRERVGAEDNFFELGGHSLLATQVVSRVRAALGIELPLQQLFATPRLAALARAVEALCGEPSVAAPGAEQAPEAAAATRVAAADPGTAVAARPKVATARPMAAAPGGVTARSMAAAAGSAATAGSAAAAGSAVAAGPAAAPEAVAATGAAAAPPPPAWPAPEAPRSTGPPSRAAVVLPEITPTPRGGEIPLSFAQERMWFANQLDPGASAYNLPNSVRLVGRLDRPVLARCFTEVVRRHEALRTRFVMAEGRPYQLVAPPMVLALPVIDLTGLAAAARQEEALGLVAAEASRPFDLARAPLLRATLLRLRADGASGAAAASGAAGAEHVLVLVMHHICADGWSLGILIREVVELYAAFSAGRPSPLPELAVQYADFALWQRRHLAGEPLAAARRYWRRQLTAAPQALLLAADRRRSSVEGFQAAEEERLLPLPLAPRLRALSRERSASLYMTLLAAWKLLLLRYTAQEDLLVGAPVANRNRLEIERLIGFFLNTLLLRTDLAGLASFDALLERVRETCLGAFAHQDLPLEQVLRAAFPERDRGAGWPLQVMFLLQNVAFDELQAPDLTFTQFVAGKRYEDLGTPIFEVGLMLVEPPAGAGGAGLLANLTYNALLFDAATIDRLLARYERLLEAVVEDPARGLWDYSLLAEEEARHVLLAGAAGASAPPAEAAHLRIARRAAAEPKAVALVAAEDSLTYGELERRASRLARHLRERGLGPGRVAALALPRSPELIVTLLAVMKSGGAYLPLDLAQPEERIAGMLEDGDAALLVSTRPALLRLPRLAAGPWPVVRLDEEEVALAARSEADRGWEVEGEALAYVLYTSGSTGRPKGVMVRHAALAGYVASVVHDYGLVARDRVLQFASIGFDASAQEIFPTLAAGATLVLRDEAMLASAAEFLARCDAWGITALHLPTAYWHQLAAAAARDPSLALPAALRLVIIGGERALPERLEDWHGWAGDRVRLVNTYGPTEATIVATRQDLDPELPPQGEVPIGRPVRGACAYVLDPRLELAPEGVPGELAIGGGGVARGYLGRPDLTAERFLPDPWSRQPGARVYRTGDLVRWLPAGDLEYLGRADQQVKIRGFRVELAEVEAALRAHPAVAECVVVAREDSPGERRLVAYWVPDAHPAALPFPAAAGAAALFRGGANAARPAAGELRAFLSRRLPDYMLPAAFVELPALPLTPSGKVDRRSLPAPSQLRPEQAAGYVAPRSGTEATVAAVWAEVLGLDRVGARDNFFDLGGHSLLIPQVLDRLETAFQVTVPLRSMFDGPTVEEQALTVEELLVDEIERGEVVGGIVR
jgi:amino acid adenylation domain-containing protein